MAMPLPEPMEEQQRRATKRRERDVDALDAMLSSQMDAQRKERRTTILAGVGIVAAVLLFIVPMLAAAPSNTLPPSPRYRPLITLPLVPQTRRTRTVSLSKFPHANTPAVSDVDLVGASSVGGMIRGPVDIEAQCRFADTWSGATGSPTTTWEFMETGLAPVPEVTPHALIYAMEAQLRKHPAFDVRVNTTASSDAASAGKNAGPTDEQLLAATVLLTAEANDGLGHCVKGGPLYDRTRARLRIAGADVWSAPNDYAIDAKYTPCNNAVTELCRIYPYTRNRLGFAARVEAVRSRDETSVVVRVRVEGVASVDAMYFEPI